MCSSELLENLEDMFPHYLCVDHGQMAEEFSS